MRSTWHMVAAQVRRWLMGQALTQTIEINRKTAEGLDAAVKEMLRK